MTTDTDRLLARAIGQAKVTRHMRLAAGALGEVAGVAGDHLGGSPVLVCADRHTWAAAGARVSEELKAKGRVGKERVGKGRAVERLVIASEPRLAPDIAISRRLAERLRDTGAAPVAVGSGVLNDLVKCAAGLAGVPYLCVPTAASMDGYAASGAAMQVEGFKRTIDCPPPVAIVADTEVIGAAPAPMAAWGYGDLVGKLVAGADWMIADALGEEALAPGPFGLVQDHLGAWLADPAGIAAGNPLAIRELTGGLMIAGFAMQAHGNSRPASGGEHQFSHLWEMEHLMVAGLPAAHGACVGVGCVAMLALYHWLLGRDLSGLDVERRVAAHPDDRAIAAEALAAEALAAEALAAQIDAMFPAGPLRDSIRAEVAGKRNAPEQRRERLVRFKEVWPELRQRLVARLPSPEDMAARLRAAGGAASPADLGFSFDKLARDYRRARLIRRRYTLLDLLDDLGLTDTGLAALFAPDGYWGRQDVGQGRAARA